MNLESLDFATCSALLAALAYSSFVGALLYKRIAADDKGLASLWFYAALLASAAWGWAGVARAYFPTVPAATIWLFDLTRYGCWFAFLLTLLAPVIASQRGRGLSLLVPGAALLVLCGAVTLLVGQPTAAGKPAPARLSLGEALALAVFGLILVEQLFRNVAAESRWNAKPLCFALGVVFFYDVYVYSQGLLFGRLDADAVSIRGAIHALAVPLLFMTSRRRHDWIRRLQISRAAAFHSTAILLAGIYLLLIAAIGYYIRYFGGEWGAALRLVILVGALVALGALAVSGTMRSRLRVWVGKNFFSYRYDYRAEWLRFTAMLSAKSSPSEMGALVIRGMADMVESPSGALWLREAGQAEFVQAARWNAPASAAREPVDSAFVSFLLEKGWILDLERERGAKPADNEVVLPPWLADAKQFWLLIPLIVADDLLGFVVLGQPRTAVDLNWEVTDLLKTASRQAAGFLAQMRMTEALLEARKFDAFNRMSAFVVHDLKNIVAQLSLMLKNAKRLHANPEFQQDMLATVENSLEKMRQLMLQLRDGEAPPGGHSGVNLVPIVRSLEAVVAERGRVVEIEVVDAVVARGHEERIERVLGHVVQNALDATEASGRVWLKLSRNSGEAKIEVGDTGSGMSQDYVQTRLFKPFETTKRTGMGIGAYESFQYVRELGGSLAVDSEPGRGTVMTITLPLFESSDVAERRLVAAP